MWTYDKDKNRATYYATSGAAGVTKGFDQATRSYWSNEFSTGDQYLQATFKYTGLLCKIRVRKYWVDAAYEYQSYGLGQELVDCMIAFTNFHRMNGIWFLLVQG